MGGIKQVFMGYSISDFGIEKTRVSISSLKAYDHMIMIRDEDRGTRIYMEKRQIPELVRFLSLVEEDFEE